MIKNIIFDFGDIFINLDKEATYRKMTKLGVSKITPQMIQVYQEYEKGLMETADFISYFSSSFPISKNDLLKSFFELSSSSSNPFTKAFCASSG